MAVYIQTVVTAPVPGREDGFNRWYDDADLPEMLQVPGFVLGQRRTAHDSRQRPCGRNLTMRTAVSEWR